MARKALGAPASDSADVLPLGQAIRSVVAVTGSEARPPTTAIVFWVGGSSEPANMGINDIWLAEE